MSDKASMVMGLGCLFAAFALLVTVWRLRNSVSPVARTLAALETVTLLPAPSSVAPVRSGLSGTTQLQAGLRQLTRRLSSQRTGSRLQLLLDKAGNPRGWTVERLQALKGLGLIGLGAFGGLIGSGSGARLILFALVAGAAGFCLPDVFVYNQGVKRQEQIQKTLPDALDLLTVSVEAGLGFDAALSQVARNTEGPIASEFVRVLQEMQIGKARREALRGLGERTTVPDLKAFASAIVQADTLGIPIANVLREQAREMRLKRQQRAEEQAQKVTVKIMIPVVLCILPSLLIVVVGPGAISIVHAFSHK
jgi:tight adherence protein C